MKKFFRDLVNVKEVLQPCITPPLLTVSSEGLSANEVEPLAAPGSMVDYYLSNVEISKPTIPEVPWHLNREGLAKLKFQTVVLSLVDIQTIVQTITSHKAFFLSADYTGIYKFAEKTRTALSEEEGLKASILSSTSLSIGGKLQYMMFIQEFMPQDMECDYVRELHVSRLPSHKDDRSIVYRVKDVVRRMLFAIDSFAAFVTRSEVYSIEDIADFLVDFSYMYKHSTDKKGTQLELLARFLRTNLPKLPEEYRLGNYRKLYNELILEYKRKHALKRISAERNLQTLLMALHMMEKHISDIKSEEKVISAFKRSSDFFAFILKERILVCIRRCRTPEGAQVLQVTKASGSVRNSKITDYMSTFVSTIVEFTKEFCVFEEVQRATESEEDFGNARAAFLQYLAIVRAKLEEHPQYIRRTSDEVDLVFEDITKYMTRKMNKEVFPPWASAADLRFRKSCLDLDWVTPEDLKLDITLPNKMFTEAVGTLRDTDHSLSPQTKLASMVEAVSLVLNEAEFGATLDTLEKPENSLPYIIYLMLAAQPDRFWSNMNFIAKFWHPMKAEMQPWLCYTLLKSAARLIENADASTFRLSREAFTQRVQGSRSRRSTGSRSY
jgi:hypothetical protein